MGKCTVVYDKLKLKFEVDDIFKIYRAVNEINHGMACGEPYASVTEFINELNLDKSYYNPTLDTWGWSIEKTGLIDIDISLGIIDSQPVLKLRFVPEPIGDFYKLW